MGNILQSWEWERGKFDFDHHFALLTNFLKLYISFCLLESSLFRLVERIIFKKNVSKTDLLFRFCKIGLRNTLFIFGRKNCPFFCFFVCCNTLSNYDSDNVVKTSCLSFHENKLHFSSPQRISSLTASSTTRVAGS